MANTSSRTLRLLSLLQTRRWWPGPLLAERLDVSPRTLRRDVDRLRELGYPVDAAPGVEGGYALAAGTALPPLVVDDEEAMALAVAIQSQLVAGTGGEAAVRAFTKVVQVMPRRLRLRLDAVQAATTPARWGDEPTEHLDHEVLAVLALACRDGERVRFSYATVSRGSSFRRLEPLRLVPLGRRWYLVGYDLDRADWRTFRIDRISAAEGTGVPFAPRTPPFDDVAAFVLAGVQGAEARGAGTHEVEAVVEAPAAAVTARIGGWARVEERTDQTCTFRMETDDLGRALIALAMIGAPFTVVRPPELATRVRAWADRFTAAARNSEAAAVAHD
ncbi:helix-turn-helix transcriptional regulator [Microlunatus antarcticus]|uniref:Putative DNA-binding transcriptional regulator YafY n=1 Tax=Microlunatus antarcticus TaxID=53388 RepID=A0A7W5P5R0_9ACTN|nr:WYL domain-containing protein [Microlunatus antarcticus]MBB3325658.1 putative DNA-binding transcriptional regulator YafY [Microlunatus antarcticus]